MKLTNERLNFYCATREKPQIATPYLLPTATHFSVVCPVCDEVTLIPIEVPAPGEE